MSEAIRWGIIGTGNIAKQFARGLSVVDDAELVAIGSRSQESADKFGDEFGIPTRHASYEALASDADVQAVYIATPHPYHKPNALLCLQHRKATLVEKPFAINAAEAKTVINYAREQGVFLMEAMWTRYFPVMVKLRELLAEGAIGDVMMLNADFGFRTGSVNPQHRLYNPELGGGALLDVGIYPVSLASMVFGKQPSRIASLAHLGETGVDEQSVMVFGYDHNETAICSTAIRTSTIHEARIYGTDGNIHIPDWWHPTQMTISRKGQESETLHLPIEGNGYNYEALEVMDCMRAGKKESDVTPLDETLAIMQTLDSVRKQWGLTYPME